MSFLGNSTILPAYDRTLPTGYLQRDPTGYVRQEPTDSLQRESTGYLQREPTPTGYVQREPTPTGYTRHEATVRSREPAVRSREPAVRSREPTVRTREPVMSLGYDHSRSSTTPTALHRVSRTPDRQLVSRYNPGYTTGSRNPTSRSSIRACLVCGQRAYSYMQLCPQHLQSAHLATCRKCRRQPASSNVGLCRDCQNSWTLSRGGSGSSSKSYMHMY